MGPFFSGGKDRGKKGGGEVALCSHGGQVQWNAGEAVVWAHDYSSLPIPQDDRNPTGQVVIEESNKKIEEFRSKAPGMESSMCIFDRRAMIISCG
jgi:hypothetical protein